MDIFKILSRGASLKKSNRVSSGFSGEKPKKPNVTKQVEKETDFFHTRKHEPEAKEENESEEEDIPPQITTAEEAARLRKRSKANVTGNDIPLPIGSFHDLVSRFSLDKKLLRNLIEADFTEPTAIQSECIPISLFNRDLIACAPTGSGKSLAYLIPLVQQIQESSDKGLCGLVVCPTNELASQLSHELAKLLRGKKISANILSKSLAAKLKNKAVSSTKFNLLVSTPLRLIEVVKQGALDLSQVQHIVFDEADKLFEEGFLKQTDVILAECTNPSLQKSMFSATIPSGVEEMAHSIMSSPIRVIIGHKEAASSTIHQKLVYTGNEQGKLLAIRQMIQNSEFKPPIIIFLQSITRAKALFHELLYDRLNVDMIHAERTPAQREEAIENFKKGKVWVLICTDVLARGIDFKGVNLVINYDVPQSAQAYVHRIGRTGRAGRDGCAVTFFTKEDSVGVKSVINVMKQSDSHEGVSEWMESLGKITQREKKQLKKAPVDRKAISTVPGMDRKKRRMRKEMVEASKKRKSESIPEQSDVADP